MASARAGRRAARDDVWSLGVAFFSRLFLKRGSDISWPESHSGPDVVPS